MDVYSPSHPTDQDADCENTGENFEVGIESSRCLGRAVSGAGSTSLIETSCLMKSPDLSPTLSTSSNMLSDALTVGQDAPMTESFDPPEASLSKTDEIANEKDSKKISSESPLLKDGNRLFNGDQSTRTTGKSAGDQKGTTLDNIDQKIGGHCSHKSKSPGPYKGSNRYSASKSSRYRSRSPRRRHDSRSSRRRSSSHSRYRNSHNRRHSRSRSRDRHYRRSRSALRSRHDRRRRDSHRDRRTRSRSHSRQNKDNGSEPRGLRKDQSACVLTTTSMGLVTSTASVMPPLPENTIKNDPIDHQYDMDETSTPDISEDHLPVARNMNENVAFVFQNHPPPPPLTSAPNFFDWKQKSQNPPAFGQINHPSNLQQLPGSLVRDTLHNQSRPGSYDGNYQARRLNSSAMKELPPNLMSQRPAFNPAYVNRFPGAPPAQFMTINGMLNPLLPFGGILGQPPPPPPPPPSLPSNLSYSAPPPPFIQHINTNSSLPLQQQSHTEVSSRPALASPPPPPPPPSQSNLLETLMSKVGLPTDGIAALSSTSAGGAIPMATIPLPEPIEDKSPMKKINKLLNSAANTLLNQLNVPVSTDGSPPPPPPPPPLTCRSAGKSDQCLSPTKSSMPPLPIIGGIMGSSEVPNGNGSGPTDGKKHKHRLQYNIQEMLARRKRSEFSSTREWQERIALEVKSFIKPFYAAGKVSKEDCRTVLKKSVNKISRSSCTSINTKKIGEFVKLYLRKYYKYRKWQARQQKLHSEPAAKDPSVQ
ncbi:unnamed protein product [Hydatigera taeniaeformis]|uniref:RRM domain-containing protein n=1 Tax=Hydatigena taeniaeformis TaxID=6205 RepID=A0A0R3WLR1_HYDTA|nr:unnamed protein product [Hydatigera taeniaeformis]